MQEEKGLGRRKEKEKEKHQMMEFLNIDYKVQIFRVNKSTRDKKGPPKRS